MKLSTDRVLGCLYAGAIGDAVGYPYEGQRGPICIDPHREWQLSDDTQLTLATCAAIVAERGVSPQRIAGQLADGYRARQFSGLGASTLKALSELAAGGHWALVGRKGEMAAGNGAACRIAPLAFVMSVEDVADRQTIRDVCRITHHNDEAYLGALAVLTAVQWAAGGRWQGESDLLERIAATLPDCRICDRLNELGRQRLSLTIEQAASKFGCSGFVVESVPLALYSATMLQAIGFQRTIESIVSAGGDCDTIASMAGQVMGAFCGLPGLPQAHVDRVSGLSGFRDIAHEFADFVCRT